MSKKFPDHPNNPERVCWGCDQYCSAQDMRCGNGSDRTPHPAELFGEDWREWGGPGAAATDDASRNPPVVVASPVATNTPVIASSLDASA